MPSQPPRLVLASASPRRLALLAQLGIEPAETFSPNIDESPLPRELPRPYVLRMARAMSIEVKNVMLVGCEPETLGGEEGHMGLSAAVEAAVDEAVRLVESLVNKVLGKKVVDKDGPGSSR